MVTPKFILSTSPPFPGCLLITIYKVLVRSRFIMVLFITLPSRDILVYSTIIKHFWSRESTNFFFSKGHNRLMDLLYPCNLQIPFSSCNIHDIDFAFRHGIHSIFTGTHVYSLQSRLPGWEKRGLPACLPAPNQALLLLLANPAHRYHLWGYWKGFFVQQQQCGIH